MIRRRRLRTFTLWTGTTLCVLIAVAFVVSAWWSVAAGAGRLEIAVSSGACTAVLWDRTGRDYEFRRHSSSLRDWNFWEYVSSLQEPTHFDSLISVPLWLPFLFVGLPTLLVWRFVPRFPRGHCRRCGYDLKGLTEARCPECGTGFGECESADRACG